MVIDSNARMPADVALLDEDGQVLQIVATSGQQSRSERRAVNECKVINLPLRPVKLPNEDGSVDLAAVMRHLGERGCV